MGSRPSERELARMEIQELFHVCFNLLTSFQLHLKELGRANAVAPTMRPLLDEMNRIAQELRQAEEALRARMIPLMA